MHKHRIAAGLAAMVSVTLMVGGAWAAPAAHADPAGAVYTVISPDVTDPSTVCQNGNPTQNCNLYYAKDAVFLNATQITPGDYVFAVVDPGGKNDPSDGSPALLSTDPMSARQFTVAPGGIVTTSPHAVVGNMIQLIPFADTPNPGGVYQAVVCPMGAVDPATGMIDAAQCAKSDNFKIVASTGSLLVAADATLAWTKTTTTPVWQKEIRPVWQQEIQRTYRPQYALPVAQGLDTTMVSRLAYSGTDAKATPSNGYVFKNGHTVVTLDMAQATGADGQWITIADSSYNSNGKKTPAEYNRPIDYQYNVKIVNNALTISFDNRLISASVGAYAACSLVKDSKGVVNIDGSFPGNAPKHYAGGVTLTLTSPCSQVYLYTHFEAGSLSWYPSLTDYRFVGDKLVDTTVTKDAWVRDDIAADYWVRDDSTTENMTAAYDGAFSVSVADASGVVWTCDGTLAMCGQATLAPGTYTVTLSAVGLDPIDQTVTVIAGQAVTADFGAITVQGDPEFVTADKTYLPDIVLAKVYLDPVYTDVIGAPIYLNGPLKNI